MNHIEYNRSSAIGAEIVAQIRDEVNIVHRGELLWSRLNEMKRTSVPNQEDTIDFTFLADKLSTTVEEAERLWNEFNSRHGQIQNAKPAIVQCAALAG